MKQIPDDPRKTKQIVSNLHVAESERTELAMNVRTEDGMTNGAGNVVKKSTITSERQTIWYNMGTV